MRFLPKLPHRVHPLVASVLLGAGVVSMTPGFANTTLTFLQRPEDEFFLPRWPTLFEGVSGTQEVDRGKFDLPALRPGYFQETKGLRKTDELSEQDVFRYEIALSDAWNANALTRFFENVESRSRLGFGQVVTSADGRANASGSLGANVDVWRDDVLDIALEGELLQYEGGSGNDSSHDSQWGRARASAKVFPWELGELERLGLGLLGTSRYNTPTGIERDVWVHVGPVLRIGSKGFTVDVLAGYYTSLGELDDDIPKEHTGMKRHHLDFDVDASGVTSHVEIVKELASGVSFVLDGGVQMDSGRIRQAGGRAAVRVPLTAFLLQPTGDSRDRSAWSGVSIRVGVEGRHFDLGSRNVLPFSEEFSGTFSIVYAVE